MKHLNNISVGLVVFMASFVTLDVLIFICNYIYDRDLMEIPLIISILTAYLYREKF